MSCLSLGYWLSSEEHGPRESVTLAARAEAVGFPSAMISDHFHPWVPVQGQSPFVWTVLGGIAQVTTTLRIGTGVTAPILRMHPVVVAQAAATAAVMLEGRFFLGLGTGERLNEQVVGRRWPPATERREMLEEGVAIIRDLLAGDEVTRTGPHHRVEHARLFTRPETPPPLYLAGSSKAGAALAGRLADGFLGVAPSARHIDTFEGMGGAGKPRAGQIHVCWAASEDEARRTAHRLWPIGGMPGALLSELARPADYARAAELVGPEDVAASVVCGPDPARHLDAIAAFAAAGFTEVYVHQVGPDQEGFFRFYQDHIFPAVPPAGAIDPPASPVDPVDRIR